MVSVELLGAEGTFGPFGLDILATLGTFGVGRGLLLRCILELVAARRASEPFVLYLVPTLWTLGLGGLDGRWWGLQVVGT